MNTMLRTQGGYSARASLSRYTLLGGILWVLSPSNVQVVRAAKVCSQNSSGETICHNKLSGGVIAAIVVTITLVLLLSIGIFFYIRRSREYRTHALRSANWAIHFRNGSRSRSVDSRRSSFDKDEEAAIGDEKYMTVEQSQIQGPTWEARYDPSSAPAPGGWGSRFGRGLGRKYGNTPSSAPGGKKAISSAGVGGGGSGKARSADAKKSSSPSGSKGGKRNWGNIIHNQLGLQARSTGSRSASSVDAGGANARSRKSPGLYLSENGSFSYSSNSSDNPKLPPMSMSPRTPRHGHAPIPSSPLNPMTPPRTPQTARPPLTPRAAAQASFVPPAPPMTPRQAVLIQNAFESGMVNQGLRL